MTNTTTNSQYIGWSPSLDKRGTFNILQTCLSALFFCAYTALHLDVPSIGESRLSKAFYLAKWMIISIFCPEILLYSAALQMVGANKIQKKVDKAYKEATTDVYAEKSQWRLEHSYLSQMGGYQLVHKLSIGKADVEQSMVSKATSKMLAVRLSPDCLIDLFFNTSFSLISSTELQHRSKATNLSKVLAALQTTYLVIQVIGRLVSGLPVTELEVNTIAQVFCALIASTFWFKKPYNIEYPETIQLTSEIGGRIACRWVLRSTEWINQLLRLLNSNMDQAATHNESDHTKTGDGPLLTNTFANATRNFRETLSSTVVVDHQGTQINRFSVSRQLDKNIRFVALFNQKPSPQQCSDLVDTLRRNFEVAIPRILIVFNSTVDGADSSAKYGAPTYLDGMLKFNEARHLDINVIEANQWEYAMQYRFWTELELDKVVHDHERMIRRTNATCLKTVNSNHSMFYIPDLQEELLLGHESYVWCIIFGVILSIIYGALHAALWNAHFPTAVEAVMWRVSSLLVCTLPLLTFISYYAIVDTPGLTENTSAFAMPFLLVALTGQIFLMVEAFISLRNQPVGVYEQVSWARCIPHL